MSTTGDELPNGWTQADSEEQAGQYNPQQPIRYEREGVVLNLQPATNTTDEQDVWRITAVREDGPDGTETIREGIDGRDTALETAREFMETYNERSVEGDERTEDVVSSF